MFRPTTAIDETGSNTKPETLSRLSPVLVVDTSGGDISAQQAHHPPSDGLLIESSEGPKDKTSMPAAVVKFRGDDQTQGSCSGMEESGMEEPGMEEPEGGET